MDESAKTPEEFAWKVHDALNDWTGKVDFKASVVLALQTAVIGLIFALMTKDGPLHSLSGWRANVFYAGGAILGLALLSSSLVVAPHLNRGASRRDWKSNVIYFGHLRHWEADALAKRLTAHKDSIEQLARQLIAMSKIAWRKHSLLQISMLLLVVGSALVTAAGLGK